MNTFCFYFYCCCCYFIYNPAVAPPTGPHPISFLPCHPDDVYAITRPPLSLGPRVSQGLGTSSPTEARPDSTTTIYVPVALDQVAQSLRPPRGLG